MASAKLLDKLLAVIDDKVITLSRVQRIDKNILSFKNIAPQIYYKSKFSNQELVELLIERKLIRSGLETIGYVIGEQEVESQIKSIERRLGFDRPALITFLKENKISFDEYFNNIRETIEFDLYNSRIIRPLISITEQEIKNTFYKKNSKNNTLAFRYTLVDFSMPTSSLNKSNLKKVPQILKNYQETGQLPNYLKDIETNVIENVTADDLNTKLSNLLKSTKEGDFTSNFKLSGDYHFYFIKKKDLVQSAPYLKARPRIRAKIYERESSRISKLWFEREKNKHYIKYFL
jgi:peptidyl-prolyl cis-trans isomerase SurA